jgi:hypothetical protein
LRSVDRERDPDREAAHAARQGDLVARLDDHGHVVGLHRVVNDVNVVATTPWVEAWPGAVCDRWAPTGCELAAGAAASAAPAAGLREIERELRRFHRSRRAA